MDTVQDYQDLLTRLVAITRVLSIGILSIAAIMLASAVALIANTLRMGMWRGARRSGSCDLSARRTGASACRSDRRPGREPPRRRGGDLCAVPRQGGFIDRLRGEIRFFPLVQNHDVLAIAPWILIAATVIAVIAGTIGMRRFLDV